MKKTILTIFLVVIGLNIFTLEESYYAFDNHKLVALTFDDGPTVEYTPIVLDTLQKYDVPATFFLVGKQVENHQDLAKKIVTLGHEVGNHTYSHAHLENLSYPQVLEELNKADAVYEKVLGLEEVTFFRPPRKKINVQVVYGQYQTEKVMALWDVCGENRVVTSSKKMRDRVLKYAPTGGVILLHDGSPGSNRKLTIEALPMIIEAYKAKGYRFVTLTEYYEVTKDKKVFKQ